MSKQTCYKNTIATFAPYLSCQGMGNRGPAAVVSKEVNALDYNV